MTVSVGNENIFSLLKWERKTIQLILEEKLLEIVYNYILCTKVIHLY